MELNRDRKTSSFMIGLFVTIGSLIGFVFIVWLGASKYFEKGLTYVTYFDESVQGLQVDSVVKYRGVDAGRVLKIGVAPDNRLVEVVIKINDDRRVEPYLVAQLKSLGITGIVFIELDRRQRNETTIGPELKFTPTYPVIPSKPSEIKQIFVELADVYGRIRKIDFEGISDQFKQTAKSVDVFFNNERLNNTMKHVEAMTASLESTTQKIDRMVAEGKVDKTLVEAQQTLAETRRLMTELRNEVNAMKMADTANKAGRVLDHLDQKARKISVNMENTLQVIKTNSENINRLLERLQNNPADLVFGKPVPYNRMDEGK